MGELIGDLCFPSALIFPLHEGTYLGKAGEVFLSGGKLWLNTNGTVLEIITSA